MSDNIAAPTTNHPTPSRRFFYGYWVILVGFLCLFVQYGCGFWSFSLFVRPLQQELDWSRSAVMAGFTIFYLMIAASSPFIGKMVDRYGARRVMCLGAIIAALGFVSLMRVSQLWQFYLGYGIMGLGMAALGQIPASTIVSNWFRKKRGLAIGIMSTGVGVGGVVLAPLVGGYVIPEYGWRMAYLALGIITAVLIVPAVLLVRRERPSDVGLHPDGIVQPELPADSPALPSPAGGLSLQAALRTRAFWLIAFIYFISMISNSGTVQNQAPYLEQIGFPVIMAASALAIISLMSGVGKFVFGWLCDRMMPEYVYVIGLGSGIIGGSILLNLSDSSPSSLVWVYAVTLGLGAGSWLPTMSLLTSASFGMASYGAIFGIMSLAQSLGVSIGPLIVGRMFDAMGTYYWAFLMCVILFAASLLGILLVRRLRRDDKSSIALR